MLVGGLSVAAVGGSAPYNRVAAQIAGMREPAGPSAFSRLKGKIEAGQNTVVWVNADSTGYSQAGPYYLFFTALAARYGITCTIYRWQEWDPTAGTATGPKSYGAGEVVNVGGSQTLTVYLAALPGAVAGQMWDGSRRGAAIDAIPVPDMAIVHHGHNQSSFAQAWSGELVQGRATFLGPLGMIGLTWGDVPILMSTQNPWRDSGGYAKVYQAILSLTQAMPDLTLADTYADFMAAGKLSYLYRPGSDGNVHPSDSATNNAGARLVAGRLMAKFSSASGTSSTVAWARRAATSLLSGGDFSSWTGALPTSWGASGTGAVVQKDTLTKYGAAAYSASFLLGTTQQGQSYTFYRTLNGADRATIAGRTLTMAALYRQPSGQSRGFGVVKVKSADATGAVATRQYNSGDLLSCTDGWMLHCLSGIVADAAAASDGNTGFFFYPAFNTGIPPLAPYPVYYQKWALVEGPVPSLGV